MDQRILLWLEEDIVQRIIVGPEGLEQWNVFCVLVPLGVLLGDGGNRGLGSISTRGSVWFCDQRVFCSDSNFFFVVRLFNFLDCILWLVKFERRLIFFWMKGYYPIKIPAGQMSQLQKPIILCLSNIFFCVLGSFDHIVDAICVCWFFL